MHAKKRTALQERVNKAKLVAIKIKTTNVDQDSHLNLATLADFVAGDPAGDDDIDAQFRIAFSKLNS